jgi:hypothetical protein
VDEISAYNYHLEVLDGWYKKEIVVDQELYENNTPGAIAGEGSVMLLVNAKKPQALARVMGISTLHSTEGQVIQKHLQAFLQQFREVTIDLLLSGENGDNRLEGYYRQVEQVLDDDIAIARFKHLCGEYPTASAFGLWLACRAIGGLHLPRHMLKKNKTPTAYHHILMYNCHKGIQHSFMLVAAPE